ncbi:uncharacterized protein LOC125600461 [Brassica napus]|uniref:uncharacterized protein LOC125600461 n=1 Tax=Brassica napus TaxID=3708 RepID=UPI002078D751|nr:uncharacterized protein LOC125600461 [Brassica napus]
MDYKSVDEYDSVLFKTVSMLRLCGEVVTEEELLEKTFSTFHSSNIILQQQYRMKGFATYTDLISCLLLGEANNEFLMKNSEARPVGTATLPEANEVKKKGPNECNYIQNDKRSQGKGRGGYRNCGRDNYSNSRDNYLAGRKGNHNNRGRGSNPDRGRGSYGRGRGGISKPSYSTKSICHRCGRGNHWAKNCRTPKHLCELYQESLKNKNPDARMVHDSGYETDDDSDIAKDDLMDFETSDSCAQEKLITRPSPAKVNKEIINFLEMIQGNICGPIHPPSGTFRYFMVLIVASTRWSHVCLLST